LKKITKKITKVLCARGIRKYLFCSLKAVHVHEKDILKLSHVNC